MRDDRPEPLEPKRPKQDSDAQSKLTYLGDPARFTIKPSMLPAELQPTLLQGVPSQEKYLSVLQEYVDLCLKGQTSPVLRKRNLDGIADYACEVGTAIAARLQGEGASIAEQDSNTALNIKKFCKESYSHNMYGFLLCNLIGLCMFVAYARLLLIWTPASMNGILERFQDFKEEFLQFWREHQEAFNAEIEVSDLDNKKNFN